MKFINLYNIIILSRLTDYKIQLKDDLLALNIFNINDPKKLKMIIKYIKNGSILYPKDILIINKAYLIINRKSLDYNKFNSPQLILDQFNLLNLKLLYNPDSESCFTNKVELGKGVVVYNVQDDILGLKAVRRAVDFSWGKLANPWCLITPPLKTNAFKYWKKYSTIQKRICFKNGELKAFCANNEYYIQWWDREDHKKQLKEIVGVLDDPKAILNMLNNMSEDDKKIYFSKYSNDLNLLLKLSKDKDRLVKYYVASNSNCPINILLKLSLDENLKVRRNIAKNPNTPIKILLKLANDEDRWVRLNVAINLNCPINILLKLANDENYWVRCNVAINSNTPILILLKLSLDEKLYVRSNVAKNPNTPIKILLKLADDIDYIVRLSLASNSNCPIKVLLKLSLDKKYLVRSSVAQNPNTPIKVLLKLSNDKDWFVREIAKLKLK